MSGQRRAVFLHSQFRSHSCKEFVPTSAVLKRRDLCTRAGVTSVKPSQGCAVPKSAGQRASECLQILPAVPQPCSGVQKRCWQRGQGTAGNGVPGGMELVGGQEVAGAGAGSRARGVTCNSEGLGSIFLRVVCCILQLFVSGQCHETDGLRGDRFCGCDGTDCCNTKS